MSRVPLAGTTLSASRWKAQMGTFLNFGASERSPPPQTGTAEQIPCAELAHRDAGDVETLRINRVSFLDFAHEREHRFHERVGLIRGSEVGS
jgi:hypothetical protein